MAVERSCLVTLPDATSRVWKFFGFETDENGAIVNRTRVKCCVCDVSITYSRNTTNLTYHLLTTHKNEYESIAPETTGQSSSTPVTNQTTLPAIVNKIKPYPHESRRFQECEHSLLRLVCRAMLPISIVDHDEFRSFVDTLDARYKPSSRTHSLRFLCNNM